MLVFARWCIQLNFNIWKYDENSKSILQQAIKHFCRTQSHSSTITLTKKQQLYFTVHSFSIFILQLLDVTICSLSYNMLHYDLPLPPPTSSHIFSIVEYNPVMFTILIFPQLIPNLLVFLGWLKFNLWITSHSGMDVQEWVKEYIFNHLIFTCDALSP